MKTNNRLLDNFICLLDQLSDPRRGQGQRHDLAFVLLIVMFATMSGYLGYRAIECFLAKHHDDLIRLFQPEKDRIPSYSTVRRVLMGIDFDEFNHLYQRWLKESSLRLEDWFAIDGKALRGTVNPDDSNDYVHLVSIFSTFDQMVVSTGKVNSKSNEIPLVQQMIQDSNLRGVIFSLDALHCQKKQLQR